MEGRTGTKLDATGVAQTVWTNGKDALPCADETVIVNCWFGGADGKNTWMYQWPPPSAVVDPDPWGDVTLIVDPAAAVPENSSYGGVELQLPHVWTALKPIGGDVVSGACVVGGAVGSGACVVGGAAGAGVAGGGGGGGCVAGAAVGGGGGEGSAAGGSVGVGVSGSATGCSGTRASTDTIGSMAGGTVVATVVVVVVVVVVDAATVVVDAEVVGSSTRSAGTTRAVSSPPVIAAAPPTEIANAAAILSP